MTPIVVEQTRRGSLYEALFNILIGFSINYVANLLILPLFGFNVGLGDNFLIGLLYTGISLVRQFVIRRYCNARLRRMALHLAGQR